MSTKFPHSSELLFTIQRMCPNEAARDGFQHLYNEARRANTSDTLLSALLAYRLVDGLQYGNWPVAPATPSLELCVE